MASRLRRLGLVIAALGAVFVVMGLYGFTQVQAGHRSLQAFSAAQDVSLSYDDDGNLVDRGSVEGARAIRELLTEDWRYPVKDSELSPDDPLVNTASEYMYQMATISHHVLSGTQTVQLEEDAEYNGEVFKAGSYSFDVDGRYWTDFDRQHPIEGRAREMAWTATAHGLIAELGVGAVTASTLQLGLMVSGMALAVGAALVAMGAGLVWAVKAETAEVRFGTAR